MTPDLNNSLLKIFQCSPAIVTFQISRIARSFGGNDREEAKNLWLALFSHDGNSRKGSPEAIPLR